MFCLPPPDLAGQLGPERVSCVGCCAHALWGRLVCREHCPAGVKVSSSESSSVSDGALDDDVLFVSVAWLTCGWGVAGGRCVWCGGSHSVGKRGGRSSASIPGFLRS